jgi:hypothetical protein
VERKERVPRRAQPALSVAWKQPFPSSQRRADPCFVAHVFRKWRNRSLSLVPCVADTADGQTVSCTYPNQEIGMAEPCYMIKDTNPPLCGVHNVPLVQRPNSDDLPTSGFGNFTFLMCPVSDHVVAARQRTEVP